MPVGGSRATSATPISERLADIFTGPRMEAYRDFARFEKCSRCELLRFCRGCPAVALRQHREHVHRRSAVLEGDRARTAMHTMKAVVLERACSARRAPVEHCSGSRRDPRMGAGESQGVRDQPLGAVHADRGGERAAHPAAEESPESSAPGEIADPSDSHFERRPARRGADGRHGAEFRRELRRVHAPPLVQRLRGGHRPPLGGACGDSGNLLHGLRFSLRLSATAAGRPSAGAGSHECIGAGVGPAREERRMHGVGNQSAALADGSPSHAWRRLAAGRR